MYKFETATSEDVDSIIAMYLDGVDECSYRGVMLDIDALKTNFLNCIEDPHKGVYFILAKNEYDNVGFLCFSYHPAGPMFLPGMSFANEQMWYVKPEHRRTDVGTKLLEAFEQVAKDIGCDYVQAGFLNSTVYSEKTFTRYLETKGYTMCEKRFFKEIV